MSVILLVQNDRIENLKYLLISLKINNIKFKVSRYMLPGIMQLKFSCKSYIIYHYFKLFFKNEEIKLNDRNR